MAKYNINADKLTINHLRLALYNYIKSLKNNNLFFLTIYDFYSSKENNQQIQDNIEALKHFAIDTNNKVFQSQNLNIYKTLSFKLVQQQKAFLCFCNSNSCSCKALSKEQIEQNIKDNLPYSIKLDFENKEILIFQDNKPTKIFANSIDNIILNINSLIKSNNCLNDEPIEKFILNSLDYQEQIEYRYLQDISNNLSIKNLLQEGFLPDAIINYLIYLDLGIEKLLYLPDIIDIFDISKIDNKVKNFDIEKLRYFNRLHLKAMDSKKLSKIFSFADSDIGEVLKLFLDKNSTIKELDAIIVAIFSPKKCYNDNIKKLASLIQDAPMFGLYKDFVDYLSSKSNLNQDELEKALSLLITGSNDNIDKLEAIYRYINPYLLEIAKCQ